MKVISFLLAWRSFIGKLPPVGAAPGCGAQDQDQNQDMRSGNAFRARCEEIDVKKQRLPQRGAESSRQKRLALVLGGALALAGCATAPEGAARGGASFTPAFETADCWFQTPGQTPECGFVSVPQNRKDFSKGAINLAVAIYRSPNPEKSDIPLVYIHGGPGTPALRFETQSPGYFDNRVKPFLADRDVILFDQRGTGYSSPAVTCPAFQKAFFENAVVVRNSKELYEFAGPKFRECGRDLEAAGLDLSAYNIRELADDMDDLRRALGYEEWFLLGQSYGTRVALNAIRRRTDGVKGVILSSTAPPGALLSDGAAETRKAFELMFSNVCIPGTACGDYPGGPFAMLAAAVDGFNKVPMSVDVSFPIPGFPYTGKPVEWTFTGDQIPGLLLGAAYAPGIQAQLPAVLSGLMGRDEEAVKNLVTWNIIVPVGAMDSGAFWAISCNDTIAYESGEEIRAAFAAYPELRNMMYGRNFSFGPYTREICESFLGALDTSDRALRSPVESDLPVALFASEGDQTTPPALAFRAAETLSRSKVYLIENAAHGPLFESECALTLARTFLKDPSVFPEDRCGE